MTKVIIKNNKILFEIEMKILDRFEVILSVRFIINMCRGQATICAPIYVMKVSLLYN